MGKRYSEDQIVKIIREIEAGASVASVSRAHGVNVQTLYRWRDKYSGMGGTELAELKILQEENRRLKKIVASQAMDIEMLKELQQGKW
jgi:putative transposase